MGDNSKVGKESKKQREGDDISWKEKKVSATKTLADLPDEIKGEIFCRLHVRTLLEFRCVIRDYSRFHNPSFMKMHFHRQMEIDNASTFIVTTHSLMYKVDIQNRIPVEVEFPFYRPFHFNYDSNPRTRLILVGSCNGMLCLTRGCDYGRVVELWNPVTNYYFKKCLPSNRFRGNRLALGFGYDHRSDKFKVLAVSREGRGRNPRCEAFVHTVGTNVWRSIGEVQKFLRGPNPYNSRRKVFEGCPHWVVPSLKSVISFRVGIEKFNEIPMPFLDDGEAQVVDFALGDRLSVFSHVVKLKRYDLWVRLENTWTKQISFNELDMTGFIDGYQYNVYYGYKDTKLYGGPALLDPVINIIKSELPHCKLAEPFHVFPHVETIAPVIEDGILYDGPEYPHCKLTEPFYVFPHDENIAPAIDEDPIL